MPRKTYTSGEGVETPAEEEARLPQELAELQRPQNILKLKAQIEAARKGNATSDEHAHPCCLMTLKAEEKAHSETQAQLAQKSLELDNLRIEYANREKELFDIESKLKQAEAELERTTRARAEEQDAHDQTKASLKTMTESKDQEQNAHKETKSALKAETDSRKQERTEHEQTKASLRAENALRVQEVAAHGQTKNDLTKMTALKVGEEAERKRIQNELEVITKSKNEDQSKNSILQDELREAKAENERKEEKIRDLEWEARTVPPPVQDIQFQDGYPKPVEGGWTLLSDSYRINPRGEISTYKKDNGGGKGKRYSGR